MTDVEPISDESLDKLRVVYDVYSATGEKMATLSRRLLGGIIARIDAERARADRVCRWQIKGHNQAQWWSECETQYHHEDYYGIDHPDFCPICGGKVVEVTPDVATPQAPNAPAKRRVSRPLDPIIGNSDKENNT